MITETLLFAAAILAGLLLGVFTARAAHQKDKVHGGRLAQVCHYLAAASFTTLSLTLPLLIVGLLLRVHFSTLLPYLLSLITLMILFLLGYAVLERRVRIHLEPDDHAWSEHDARTSGL
jgi:hypothetical protein